MDTVHIETSIISHASARHSGDPTIAALQDQAKRWLAEVSRNYNLVSSQFVIDEASLGDPAAAAERLELLADIPVLLPEARVEQVADEIIARSLMPPNAKLDA